MKIYKIKDCIELDVLRQRGFKYDKVIDEHILMKSYNTNWNQMVLSVGEDRMVRPCGSSIDYEKEVEVIRDLLEEINYEV